MALRLAHMLNDILTFLLDIAVGLVGGACLIRLYMQRERTPFGNPIGRLVFALSDWIVLPLRRVLPSIGRWDTASFVAAYLLELAQFAILALLHGAMAALPFVPVLALFGLLRLAVSCAMGLLIMYAVLSWVQNGSPLYDLIDRLCAPLLRPIRRAIPLVGGVDLSPLVALVVLQVLLMVLAHVQRAALGWGW